MRLYSNQERPFSEIRHVAVTIATVRGNQRHLGILHKLEVFDEVKLGHLAWHNKLKESLPSDSYLWVDPPIPSRRARQVAASLRLILRANAENMPYAFSPPNDCFDLQNGRFLIGPNRTGLTCASFVLAVFGAAGIKLAEYDTWPKQRNGDVEWQQFIIEQLENSGATIQHLYAVKTEVGSIRYRPEDVAGCAASEQVPCVFEVAEPLSLNIISRLETHGKPLQA